MSVVTFTSSIDLPLDMFFSVEREQLAFALDNGLQMHRPRPDREQILQRILSIIEAQVNTFVTMIEQQFAAVFEIAVGDIDERLSEIRQREEKLLLDALPVSVGNLVDPALGVELIREKPFFVAELFGEERVDESNVVVNPSRFKNLFAAEAQAEVPFALRNVVVAFLI